MIQEDKESVTFARNDDDEISCDFFQITSEADGDTASIWLAVTGHWAYVVFTKM